MKKVDYVRVDVFARKPFGGNPLAVFPDGRGLTDKQMQQLAREMNLSETTFVQPPTRGSGADFRVRIFTPDMEVPYAGHPTIGTFYVLSTLGRIKLKGPVTTAKMEVKAGVLPVEIHSRKGKVERVVTVQNRPVFAEPYPDPGLVAEALSIRREDIWTEKAPVQLVSTGLPWLMVLARSRKVVEGVRGNPQAFIEAVKDLPKGVLDIYITSLDPVEKGSGTHSRGLSLVLGSIVEDPATGSASGNLGSYLAHHGLMAPKNGRISFINEQGYEIGRPSKISVDVGMSGGQVDSVRVGGTVVRMMDGTAYL